MSKSHRATSRSVLAGALAVTLALGGGGIALADPPKPAPAPAPVDPNAPRTTALPGEPPVAAGLVRMTVPGIQLPGMPAGKIDLPQLPDMPVLRQISQTVASALDAALNAFNQATQDQRTAYTAMSPAERTLADARNVVHEAEAIHGKDSKEAKDARENFQHVRDELTDKASKGDKDIQYALSDKTSQKLQEDGSSLPVIKARDALTKARDEVPEKQRPKYENPTVSDKGQVVIDGYAPPKIETTSAKPSPTKTPERTVEKTATKTPTKTVTKTQEPERETTKTETPEKTSTRPKETPAKPVDEGVNEAGIFYQSGVGIPSDWGTLPKIEGREDGNGTRAEKLRNSLASRSKDLSVQGKNTVPIVILTDSGFASEAGKPMPDWDVIRRDWLENNVFVVLATKDGKAPAPVADTKLKYQNQIKYVPYAKESPDQADAKAVKDAVAVQVTAIRAIKDKVNIGKAGDAPAAVANSTTREAPAPKPGSALFDQNKVRAYIQRVEDNRLKNDWNDLAKWANTSDPDSGLPAFAYNSDNQFASTVSRAQQAARTIPHADFSRPFGPWTSGNADLLNRDVSNPKSVNRDVVDNPEKLAGQVKAFKDNGKWSQRKRGAITVSTNLGEVKDMVPEGVPANRVRIDTGINLAKKPDYGDNGESRVVGDAVDKLSVPDDAVKDVDPSRIYVMGLGGKDDWNAVPEFGGWNKNGSGIGADKVSKLKAITEDKGMLIYVVAPEMVDRANKNLEGLANLNVVDRKALGFEDAGKIKEHIKIVSSADKDQIRKLIADANDKLNAENQVVANQPGGWDQSLEDAIRETIKFHGYVNTASTLKK